MNKSVKKLISTLIVLIILSLVFYPRIKELLKKPENLNGDVGSSPSQEKSSMKATAVEASIVSFLPLNEIVSSTGTILPNEEVEIHTEIPGRITYLNISEGAQVEKGTILLKINDDDLKARLKKLEYNKKLAEDNELRQKILFQKEAISKSEFDIAVNSVNTISADIEDLNAQIKKTTIRAPFSGKLGFRFVSEGSYITPSSVITNIVNTNPIKLEFSIPSKYAGDVKIGTKIQFTTESSSGNFEGKVYAVNPVIDNNTRTLQIRAIAPNPKGHLVPGAFARVSIILQQKNEAMQIPTESIITDATGSKVYKIVNGEAIYTTIRIGVRGEKLVEVLDGLNIGDTLVVSGVVQLRPNSPVKINKIN
jgi:membrane fusion protein (multidrug efflux system)